jgi:hypothetical protein
MGYGNTMILDDLLAMNEAFNTQPNHFIGNHHDKN